MKRQTHSPLRDHGRAVHRCLERALTCVRLAEIRGHQWSDDVAARVVAKLEPGRDAMSDPEYEAADQLLSNLVQLHDLVAAQVQAWNARVDRDGVPRPLPDQGGDL